ncbi:D-alanyl-D-alanine carboxypeptidase family protein [Candidatus Saccharibacteria bacterium]|nr:D-alanyl-D-alanine carboxypeptidase family protein [Candidatus Saccharibacteria bacterium]
MKAELKSKTKKTGRLFILLLGFFLTVFINSPAAAALSQNDLHSIYNDTVWYKASGGQSGSPADFFCLGGPGGSGPLYGPLFPKVPDTAALAGAIKIYIQNTRPDSPLIALSSAFVGYGQQYNVSPALIVAIAQKETSLATAGHAKPPKYNIGNIRGDDDGDGTGFKSYSGYQEGLEAMYQNLRRDQYLDPPSSFTTIAQVITRWAPPEDGNDTAGYIIFVGDVMKEIFRSLKDIPPDVSADSCQAVEVAPITGEDDSKTPCDPRTENLGIQQGYRDGNPVAIRICALRGFASTSEESRPGSQYYVEGANGHALVNAAASTAFYELTKAAQQAGRLSRGAASSFRTMAHQQELWDDNPNPKFVARPGYSNHQMGLAIDFYINNLSVDSDQCITVSGRCTAQDYPDWEWLNSNASKFGIQQYVNEFWHWSTNGR